MNLNEFQELSKRTMPYNGEPANQVEFESMLGNYAMGLVGEAIELFEVFSHEHSSAEDNEKEIGDVLHYAVGLASILNISLEDVGAKRLGLFDTEFDMMKDLLVSAKNVSEQVKKIVYHRHEDDVPQSALKGVIAGLYQTANFLGCNMPEIMQMNIDKLKTRYPESFNTEDSINRVDVVSNK